MDDEDTTARIAARIAERARREHREAGIDEVLARRLPGNELGSLLLHVLRERARGRTFAELRDLAERLPASESADLDARRFHAFDGAAFEAAEFHALDLAPVEPLGTGAAVGIDPNNVLGALRSLEVAHDPATGLALAAMRTRRNGDRATLRLCASQRVLRTTPFENPDFRPHFRMFALATAMRRERGSSVDECERRALLDQLRTWLASSSAPRRAASLLRRCGSRSATPGWCGRR